jgi:signal transduction histidine kinase
MSDISVQRELEQAVASLESDRSAVPWTQRRSLAAAISVSLRRSDLRGIAIRIAHLLSTDPKWEVRKEIALILPSLPDDEFAPLAAKLTEDSNGFVRKAAERSFDRRRRGRVEGDRRRSGFPRLLEEVNSLANTHGERVARKVHRLAEQLYDVMAGSAVHELRGILTPLKATTSKLRDRMKRHDFNSDSIGCGLDTIAKRLDLLERFVNDMRAYSEPVPPARTLESVADLIAEVRQMAVQYVGSMGFEADRITLSVAVPPQARFPMARHYMVAALRNILVNAFEAVLAREEDVGLGEISVTANVVEDAEARIVVEDNGIGISDDDLCELRAFVPGRISKKGNGTGFGLPTAQRYVEAHGGTLLIESTEGAGTTVSMVLPFQGWSETHK